MKICILAFSEGKNLELAKLFEEKLKSMGVTASVLDLVEVDLPLYTTKNEKIYDPATLISPFRELLNAEGFIFVAPEYNGGPPPSFSNFLAWVSRSTKQWREVFNMRPAAIATHSAGGGLNVLTIMRLQLAYVGMNVLGRQIHTTLQKVIEDKSLTEVCRELVKQAEKV
jgi:chromate reductase, NAD(P)H dehydrogenase (quinone)